jgi:hypothetical protein
VPILVFDLDIPILSFSNRDAKGKHKVIDQARFLLPPSPFL